MAQVSLENVWKVYPGNVEAVRDVSVAIKDGEFVVLVGPSGCGKSTTLRMIAGLEDISSGTVRIGDKVVNTVHPKNRDIAMVFQNYALYPHMSVYKNMAFALKLRKVPKDQIDQRVRHAADILGITEYLERKPKALSGGQRQRVALGRAIVREPKAFLFDEPLSNLDAKLRVSTRGELKALHHRLKTTTVYVTHDQEEAMTLGDRVVVMSQGLVQQADTPFEVYTNPINRFVAGFIGTPPMNFIGGRLIKAGDALKFVEAGNGLELHIANKHKPALIKHVDKGVVLGVRPQALDEVSGDIRDAAQEQGRLMELEVEVVEPLGDQMDVHGKTAGGLRFTARVRAHGDLPIGSKAQLAIDAERVNVFAPGEFGDNLLLKR